MASRIVPILTAAGLLAVALAIGISDDRAVELVLLSVTAGLTVIALVLSLSHDPTSSWPDIGSVLRRWYVVTWVGLSTVALLTLLLPRPDVRGVTPRALVHLPGDLSLELPRWLAGVPQAVAMHPSRTASGASFAAALLATWLLLAESGGRAQRQMLGGLVAHDLRRPLQEPAGVRRHLQAFETSFRTAVAEGDLGLIHQRTEELQEAGMVLAKRRAVPSLRRLLATDLRCTDALQQSVLHSWGADPDGTAARLEGLVDLVVEHSGAYLAAMKDKTTSESTSGEAQVAAAVALGTAMTLLGRLQHAVLARHDAGAVSGELTAAVAVACQRGRRRLVALADPDPPGVPIAVEHPWYHGFNDPTAGLAFLHGTADPWGGPGGALYAIHEITAGEKFPYSFSASDVCMLTSIHEHVAVDCVRGDHVSRDGSPPARAREAIAAVGGVRRMSLELLVSILATIPSRHLRVPEELAGTSSFDPRPESRSKILRFATMLRCQRTRTASEALADLAWLGASSGLPSDRRSLYAWGQRVYAKHRLPGAPAHRPPLSSQRPAAAVLACALRLVPLEGDGSKAELERFLTLIPDPTARAAAMWSDRWFTGPDVRGDPRRAVVQRVLEIQRTEI